MPVIPDETQIVSKDQLEVMVSPRAHDIVDRLVADGPLSIKEIAAQIGCRPSSLYHHIAKLMSVGLVVESGSRVVRRRRELLYDACAPRLRFTRALLDWEHPEVLTQMVYSLTRQMARDFEHGAASPFRIADGPGRNFRFGRLIGRPTPAQQVRINECLAEINDIMWGHTDESAPAVAFGWVISPLEQTDSS